MSLIRFKRYCVRRIETGQDLVMERIVEVAAEKMDYWKYTFPCAQTQFAARLKKL